MPYRSTLTAVVKAKSLRKQLLYPLIWVWTLGMVVAFVLGHHLVHSAGGRAFDSQLEEDVRDLATMVRWADGVPSLDVDRRSLGLLGLDGQGGNRFAVALRGGALLGGDLRVLRLADCEPASAGEPVHFDALLDGAGLHGVCLFVAGPAGAATVQVVITEASGRRQALLRDVLVGELSPLFLLGLATFLMLHWNMRRTMMPLSRLADELALRQPHDLQPLTTTGLPTELEPLRDRLNELFQALDLAARQQRRFVADAAHQLRTPVAGLQVLAHSLKEDLMAGRRSPDVQAVAQALGQSSQRMGRLIQQLLVLARAEASSAPGTQDEEQLDVMELVRHKVADWVPDAMRKGKNLGVEGPSSLKVRTSAFWMGELLDNLLDNALRYGGEEVWIETGESPGRIWVAVCDNGEGIAPQDQRKVFEPFWRGDRADQRTDASSGSGLGLAIVHEVSERLGGELRLSSRPEFEGTRIALSLPVA